MARRRPQGNAPARRRVGVTFDDIRDVGLTLPGAQLSQYYGQPALKVGGKMFACLASHSSAEPHSLVVRVAFSDRTALLAEAPDIYYLTPHYEGYPGVLARLDRLGQDAIKDLLLVGWRVARAGK